LEDNDELDYVVEISSKMLSAFGDIQELINEGLSIEEVE
jgi:hypothetical protein